MQGCCTLAYPVCGRSKTSHPPGFRLAHPALTVAWAGASGFYPSDAVQKAQAYCIARDIQRLPLSLLLMALVPPFGTGRAGHWP